MASIEGWENTLYEEYKNTPESELRYYVYMWLERVGDILVPFYVGMGSGRRVYLVSGRSKVLLEYIKGREIEKKIVAPNLTYFIAVRLEEELKKELKVKGYKIIDAEDDREERKRRQAEGIAAMPVVDGKKVSAKTGRGFGRPKKEVEAKRLPGESVTAACERLGISRRTWYRLQEA